MYVCARVKMVEEGWGKISLSFRQVAEGKEADTNGKDNK